MAIDDEIQARLIVQDELNQKLENRHDFFMKLVTGTANDPNSFDRNGVPGSDPDHDDLGYYPVFNENNEVVYKPCLDRLKEDGDEDVQFMSIFGDDVSAYSMVSMINLDKLTGRLAGESGSYVLVPVTEGSEAIHLSNSAGVILPFDQNHAKARAMLFTEMQDDGIRVLLGASNAPIPQPDVPEEPLDLGSGRYLYAALDEVTQLNIYLGPVDGDEFNILIPDDLPLVTVEPYIEYDEKSFGFQFSNFSNPDHPTTGPWEISGDGLVQPVYLNGGGGPAEQWDEDNNPTMLNTMGFSSPGLGLNFPNNDNLAKKQVPPRLAVDIDCELIDNGMPLLWFLDYGSGSYGIFTMFHGWQMIGYTSVTSFTKHIPDPNVTYGGRHIYTIEWIDDPEGDGGTLNFYQDGVLTVTDTVNAKFRITPASQLYINNAGGNYADARSGVKLYGYNIRYDKARVEYNYVPFEGNIITRDQISRLAVDARGLTEQQPEMVITWNLRVSEEEHGPNSEMTIQIGDVILPEYRAYKAVLVTYDEEGDEVHHTDNELVMTKFTVQNAMYEDPILFTTQPAWSEVIPQGEPPVINDIVYTCNGIRMGNYVQFQFGYHLSSECNITEPFGDLNNLNGGDGVNAFMVPHKWFIYDQYDNLLHRVEQPNGDALNKPDKPAFQGPWTSILAARPMPHTSAANPFFPSGTIGSGVIWSSHRPEAHDRSFVKANMMIPREIIPQASRNDSAVNGMDFKYAMGFANSGGQFNGWSNCRIQPYEPTDYETYTADTGNSGDPVPGLDTVLSRGTNAIIHLKYTPFNTMGRSILTGPGGARDDRAAIAEPVAWYVADPEGSRAHDGTPYVDLAFDYLRGYVSDSHHVFENGKIGPLFKDDDQRYIGQIGHYYGAGDLGLPESNRYYCYVGRVDGWVQSGNPLKVRAGTGFDEDHHHRGGHNIDAAHAHQFPGWGSILWKTPEFSFMQCKFFDMDRLYFGAGGSLMSIYGDAAYWERGFAWIWLHAALCWKHGSVNSPRLYSRAYMLKWAARGLELFYDTWMATNPGFLNPPVVGQRSAWEPRHMHLFAFVARFGVVHYDGGGNLETQGFMTGYYLHAMGHAEKMGFHDALREYSDKAGAVVDWMIAIYRRGYVGRLMHPTSLPNYSTYDDVVIPVDDMNFLYSGGTAAGDPCGNIDALPMSWEEIYEAYPGNAQWDISDQYGDHFKLDGQSMDYLLSAPSVLKYALNCEGPDIEAAIAKADARIQQKKDEWAALTTLYDKVTHWWGVNQTANNPIMPPDDED